MHGIAVSIVVVNLVAARVQGSRPEDAIFTAGMQPLDNRQMKVSFKEGNHQFLKS